MKVDLCKPEVSLMQIVIRMRSEQVLEHRLAFVGFLIRDQVGVEVPLSNQDQIHDVVLQEEWVLCTEEWLWSCSVEITSRDISIVFVLYQMSKESTLLIFLLDGRRLKVLFAFLLNPLLGLLDHHVPLLIFGVGLPNHALNLIVFDLYFNLDIVNVSVALSPWDLWQI